MLLARLSGNYVYALSSTRNLYVFDKRSGKLLTIVAVPATKPEGIEAAGDSLVVFGLSELFKLT